MTRIIIEAIPADKQRYPTDGDWYFDKSNGDLHIRITGADILDEDQAFLWALHEMVEVKLCHKHGITQGAVDAFDIQFEKDRGPRGLDDDVEPGDDPAAPYRREHRAAMLIEHMMAIFLGKWDYGEVR